VNGCHQKQGLTTVRLTRQSLLTAWKFRNTHADPRSGPPFPNQRRSSFLTQDQLPLLWVCLNLQQPKSNDSTTSCKAPNSGEPRAGALSCLQASAAAFGEGSWTGVNFGVPSFIPSCSPLHSFELTTSFLTLIRGLTMCHRQFTASACVDRSVIDPFISWYLRILFSPPPTHLHHPLHGLPHLREVNTAIILRGRQNTNFTPCTQLYCLLVLMPGLTACPVANTVIITARNHVVPFQSLFPGSHHNPI